MRRSLVVLFAGLMAAVALPGPARAAFPGDDGKIAVLDDSEESRVLIIDPETGTVVAGPRGSRPRWSPGGTMLTVLIGEVVHAFDPDGTNRRELLSLANHISVGGFAWSPDGRHIVYSAWAPEGTGDHELWIASIDGGPPRRLTFRPQADTSPAWSPDGEWIAYTRTIYNYGPDFHITHEIWIIRPDRSEVRRLTSGHQDLGADWSPDGSSIIFRRAPRTSFEEAGVFTVDPDGTNLQRLVPPTGSSAPGAATYSPSGDFVAYTSAGFLGPLEIITLDGTPVDEFVHGVVPDWQPLPAFPLVDARFSAFDDDIAWAHEAGITFGCSAERFCPTATVTREQLAAFLARALDLPPTDTDFFTDDEASEFEVAINRVAAAGLIVGCDVDAYCPTDPVTREQAATFLANALDLPDPVTDHFTDDEASVHEGDINRLADAGIARGCTATSFCPTQVLSRGQMVALLHRALATD